MRKLYKLILAIVWYAHGTALAILGRYKEAISSYDQALLIKPDEYRIWLFRAIALSELGRYKEAISSYDQVLSLKLDEYTIWYNRGAVLSELGRYKEAISSYDQVLLLKLDHCKAWYNRGHALNNLGRYKDALNSFDQAIKFKSDFHKAWLNRGYAQYNLGRYKDALNSFDQAIKFKSDFHEAWYNRGKALYDLGKLEEAIASFDQALEIKPDYHQAKALRWKAAGRLALDQRDLVSAAAAFNLAIEAIEVTRSEEIDIQQREKILARYIEVYFQLIQIYIELNEYDKAIEIVDRSKARNLVELMAVNDLYPKGDIPEEVKAELNRLRREITSLENFQNRQNIRLSYDESPDSRGTEFRKIKINNKEIRKRKSEELKELKQNLERLIQEKILPKDLDFSLTQKVTPLSYDQILETIPESDVNTAIISWHLTVTNLVAFLISRSFAAPIYIPYSDQSAKQLVSAYESYSQNLDNRNLSNTFPAIAEALNIDGILATVKENLPQCDRLILVPHGLLHLLPLNNLPISKA